MRNLALRFCFLTLIVMLLMVGCSELFPGPVQSTAPTAGIAQAMTTTPTSSDLIIIQSPGAAPVEAATQTFLAATLAPSSNLTPAPSATPTSCRPPSGWIVYTILPGDTLFSLAEQTGTTVDEVMKANCLESDLIIAYEIMRLPRRPPPPPAVAAQPQSSSDECASIFSCSNPNLSPLALNTGGGNIDAFLACTFSSSSSEIDFVGLRKSPPSNTVTIGEPIYFFACRFGNPTNLTASITGPNGTIKLDVRDITSLPTTELQKASENAQKVIPWYPVCDLPEGDYILNVSDGDTVVTPIILTLKDVAYARIMVKPETVEMGTRFNIYYCGYSTMDNQEVQIDLFRDTEQIDERGKSIFEHLRSWLVKINGNGWAMQKQIAGADVLKNLYFIKDYSDELDGETYFWVVK